MGWIDDDELTQAIIDTLNVKQLPNEKALPYPLPIFEGVNQVINLNDFLKRGKNVVVKSHSFTADLASATSESFYFTDVFTEAESKNRIYRLLNVGFSVLAPPSATVNSHYIFLVHLPENDIRITTWTASYANNLATYGNVLGGSTTQAPSLPNSEIFRNSWMTFQDGFKWSYTNSTDVTQTNPRDVNLIFLEEIVKGL